MGYSKENLKIHTGVPSPFFPSWESTDQISSLPSEAIFKDIHNLTFNDAEIDFNDTQFV